VSPLDRRGRAAVDRGGYLEQRVRSETGLGASGASAH
jgi:cation/acetate symporter